MARYVHDFLSPATAKIFRYLTCLFCGSWSQLQRRQRTTSIVPAEVGTLAFQLEIQRWQRMWRKQLQHPHLPLHPPLPVALPDGGKVKQPIYSQLLLVICKAGFKMCRVCDKSSVSRQSVHM